MPISICEACGRALRNGDTCPDCGIPQPARDEIRRLPYEVIHQFLEHAEELLTAGPLRQGALAFAAGSFITFGAVLSVALTVGVDSLGISRLLLGLGFSAGFILVILSGSVLFTEVNVLLPETFLSRPRDVCRRCWRFWLIAYAGNVLGALIVGLMLNGAHVLGPLQEERLFEIMAEKVEFQDLGIEGWFVVVASGIPGKILGVVFPIVAFVAIGVQHAPANMGYFAIGLIGGGSGIGWGEAIWWSIVPASLGNVVGGSVLVALLFWYTYGHSAEKRQALARASALVRQRRE